MKFSKNQAIVDKNLIVAVSNCNWGCVKSVNIRVCQNPSLRACEAIQFLKNVLLMTKLYYQKGYIDGILRIRWITGCYKKSEGNFWIFCIEYFVI